MKKTTSTITFKYGLIKSVPNQYIHKGIIVCVKQITKNQIEVECVFDNTNFNLDEALDYSRRITESIAFTNTLKSRVSSTYTSNNTYVWENLNIKTISGKAAIDIGFSISGAAPIKINNANELTHGQSLTCFNTALQHNETSEKNPRTIAIWLRLSWEALQMELGINENQLRKQIKENNIVKKEEISGFEHSVGELYVHNKKNTGVPIPIEDCIGAMQKILLYFTQ